MVHLQGYHWDMFGLCLVHALYIFGGIFGLCSGHVWVMFGVCVDDVSRIFGRCSEIFHEYLAGHRGVLKGRGSRGG